MFLRFTIIAVLSMGLGLIVFSSFEGAASGSTPLPRLVPSSAAAPKTHEASPHSIAAESALAVPPIANGSRMPIHAVRSTDLLGDTQLRYDNGTTATIRRDPLGGTTTRYSNGVTATTRPDAFGGSDTRYSNGVTATTRPDPLGGSTTHYSDGTRSTTRPDPFGTQVTTYSDGRVETVRPDPFASPTRNERK